MSSIYYVKKYIVQALLLICCIIGHTIVLLLLKHGFGCMSVIKQTISVENRLSSVLKNPGAVVSVPLVSVWRRIYGIPPYCRILDNQKKRVLQLSFQEG